MKTKNLVTPLDISSLEIERLFWWMCELEQDLRGLRNQAEEENKDKRGFTRDYLNNLYDWTDGVLRTIEIEKDKLIRMKLQSECNWGELG